MTLPPPPSPPKPRPSYWRCYNKGASPCLSLLPHANPATKTCAPHLLITNSRPHFLHHLRRHLPDVVRGPCMLSCLPQNRNEYAPHACLEGKNVWETDASKCTARTLQLGRLRARSFRPFLPAPRRTGLDTCRIIRLSGFLVSLTLALCRGRGIFDGGCRRFASR